MRLYLASSSPARLTLLRQVGIEPVVIPSAVDEDAAIAAQEAAHGPLSPAEYVQFLARLKAEDSAASARAADVVDGFILGGDSMFELDGVVYGKPHTPEKAKARWLAQRGKTGTLHSGHWLIDHRGGSAVAAAGGVDAAGVTFAADLTEDEIDYYVASGEPLEVAGAFTIDALAAPFISRIDGAPSAVIGLSLPVLRDLFRELGVGWAEVVAS